MLSPHWTGIASGGRFHLSTAAVPIVEKIGLDRVLNWFENTCGVKIGAKIPMAGFGLEAFFGFDPDKPNGECFYVNIYPQ